MSDEQRNQEVVRQVAERWNAGDLEGMLDFYDDEVEMVSSPEWPDPSIAGKEAFARYSEEWREAWQQADIDIDSIEPRDQTVLAIGAWETRGAASGIGGRMPFAILFTLRDGLVTQHRWFTDLAEGKRVAGRG